MNRTRAREYVFILLFEYRFQPDDIEAILESFIEEYKPGGQTGYIEKVVRGVVSGVKEIDAEIEEAAKGWSANRISCVCSAVLRLAVFEMLYCEDIPRAVSVNEAVALAKKYDGEESVDFVNGVLGGIQKKLGA